MPDKVKIRSIFPVTHDVLRIVTEKPSGFDFRPGQAADLSINKEGWVEEKRAFTFTSLPEDNFLEFTIKTYPERNSVTNELRKLKDNDELLIHDVFGDIAYKGEGLFIAGGAGITPFISIFKELESKDAVGNNKLIFANKSMADIIDEERFRKLLGRNFINILSDERTEQYAHGFITEDFLRKYISDNARHVYLCGPPPMMEAVEKHLEALGFDSDLIVKEAF